MNISSRLLLTTFTSALLIGCGGGGTDPISSQDAARAKIALYATGKSAIKPTVTDYNNAGISEIDNDNVEKMNQYVLELGSDAYEDWTEDSDGDGAIDGIDDFPEDSSKSKNTKPTASAQNIYLNEDNTKSVILRGSDDDGSSLTYKIVSPPANGTLSGTVPNLTYTPKKDYAGSDSFTFKTNDGIDDSSTATISLTIYPVNDAPIANKQTVNLDEDKSVNITLTGSDIDSSSLSYTTASNPTHGTLSGTAPDLKYTPYADFYGTDSFTFKTNDGKLDSVETTVNIIVNAINDKPISSSQTITTDEDNSINITLYGNDKESSNLSYEIVSYPSNGTVIGTGADKTYIPNKDYAGSDSFTYQVYDGKDYSSKATISITINAVNDKPIAITQSIDVIYETTTNITILGKDIDSDSLTYDITSLTEHGILAIVDSKLQYTPDDGYLGEDSFDFTISDGDLTSDPATVSIRVIRDPNEVLITEIYQVERLGKGGNLNKTIKLGSDTKDLYILLSNHNEANSSNPTISHNAKYISTAKMNKRVSNLKNTNNINILHAPSYITNYHFDLNSSSNTNGRYGKLASSVKYNKDTLGDTKKFYTDADGFSSIEATSKKIVSNIETNYGKKTLNIWVENDTFGDDCTKKRCLTQELIDKLADNFLKDGLDNDIYDWVTSIHGEEWGDDAQDKYNNIIQNTDEITILMTDIGEDNRIDGGLIGYFWAKDNFDSSSVNGSNERIMFYIDSVMFANTDDGGFWQLETYATLAHEFVHMIEYYQKSILLLGGSTTQDTWIMEMAAETTEDVVATKIKTNGPRAVVYTDGSAGSSNNDAGRYPLFNDDNTISLTNWNQKNIDYSKVNAFGTFLTRNYGGAKVLHDIIHNDKVGIASIEYAIQQTTQGEDRKFSDLLREWGVAVLLSDKTDIGDLPTYNTGDFTEDEYNGVTYNLGSINFFNYDPEPTIYTEAGTVNPQGNYYYKVGENLTGDIDITINLDDDTEATLIAK